MVASCAAFRRTFSSVEIYLQLVAGVLSHALILVYIMNIPGTSVPLLEGLYKEKFLSTHTRSASQGKLHPAISFLNFILSFVYDADNFLN